MVYPFAIFRPAAPHCPSCHGYLSQLGDECELCRYQAWECVEKFPYVAPELDSILDHELRLTTEDRQRVQGAIAKLEEAFPQVRLHVCLTRLAPGMDSREFGFWLLNSSPTREGECREFTVLCVVDRGNRTASFTVGYGIEVFLSDEKLRQALGAAENALREGNYAKGLEKAIRKLHGFLATAHREATYLAGKYRQLVARNEGGALSPVFQEHAALMRKASY